MMSEDTIVKYFDCECLDRDHAIRFMYFPEIDSDKSELYLGLKLGHNYYTRLVPNLVELFLISKELSIKEKDYVLDVELFWKDFWEFSFLKRISLGFYHLINKDHELDGYGDTIISHGGPNEVAEFLEKYCTDCKYEAEYIENLRSCEIENDEFILKIGYTRKDMFDFNWHPELVTSRFFIKKKWHIRLKQFFKCIFGTYSHREDVYQVSPADAHKIINVIKTYEKEIIKRNKKYIKNY